MPPKNQPAKQPPEPPDGELVPATRAGAELESRHDCLWAADLSIERMEAAGKLFELGVLNQFGVFQVATKLCAAITSVDSTVVPRDTEVACLAYTLDRTLAEVSSVAWPLAAQAYGQLLPALRSYAQTLCQIAAHERGGKDAEVLGLSRGIVFGAGQARFNLQVTASQVGEGIAECVVEEIAPIGDSCMYLLSQPSVHCAVSAYDTTDLFNKLYGQNNYADVCRLLCASRQLMTNATEAPLGDACSTDYEIVPTVVDAGLLFNAGDQSLNPSASTGRVPASQPHLSASTWATAAVAASRQTAPMFARFGLARSS